MGHKRLILALGLSLTAGAASASYAPVTDEQTFLSLVNGKELRHRFYGITLNVLDSGQVIGSAIGWGVEGTWSWQDIQSFQACEKGMEATCSALRRAASGGSCMR